MDNEYDDYYFFSKSPIVLLVASLVFQILLVLGLVSADVLHSVILIYRKCLKFTMNLILWFGCLYL